MKLPDHYFEYVKAEQECLNAIAGEWSEREPEPGEVAAYEATQERLTRLRKIAAYIRGKGYVRGDSDYRSGTEIIEGLKRNPYKKGTSESKVWVRGYIQGRSKDKVIHPKPYMDEA